MMRTDEEQAVLDSCARTADLCCNQIAKGMFAVKDGNPGKADSFLREATASIQSVMRGLQDAGARTPVVLRPWKETPIHLLNTAKTRALLAAVRALQPLADAVDAERGHLVPNDIPLGPGESRGTGWGETVAELALRLGLEVEGPKGRD